VSGLTNVTGVAAGDAHSLAVEADGTVWGWGSNNSGQIGAGLAVTRYTPVQLPGITTATAVAAGSAHSLARLADGTVRAWGDNTKGQLGDGTTNGSTTPVTVLGLQGVDRIAARANGSLARPTQANERYAYDADGQRVTRSTGGVTWLSLGGGMWEERLEASAAGPGGWVVRQVYMLQGRAVAQQEDTPGAINSPSGLVYLHGDHLGSVAVATDNVRRALARQDYTPWGEARGGDITQTTLDFTGQRKDSTGLLYYGARYYDPARGQFLSADSIVPGSASGKGGAADTLGQDAGTALRPLTTDFHEPGFAATLAQEHAFTQAKGFRFQLTAQDRQQGEGSKWQWGPQNPQALDRYSYALNNPLRYTDPSGHIIVWRVFVKWLKDFFYSECPVCEAWLAYLSFITGNPITLVGEFGAFTLDPNRLYGSDLTRIRQFGKGEKANWGRGNSQGYGGLQGAKDLFRKLTGRDPVGEFDRVELDDKLVVFRADSKSGIPKIEVTDYVTEFLEKISFNP